MTDLSRSNSLADLAARIKAEHEATAIAMRRGVEHAIRGGELLIEAKAQLKHGQWLPWLTEHCAMSERTARLYMRLARNKSEIDKNGNVADLSLRGAIALLAPLAPDERDAIPNEKQIRLGYLTTAHGQEIFCVIESAEHPGFFHVDHIELPGSNPESCMSTTTRKPVRADALRCLLEHFAHDASTLGDIEWQDHVVAPGWRLLPKA